MAIYTYVESAKHNIYPNLTVYDRLRDGVPTGWQVNAKKGFVFYDKNTADTKLDPTTMENVPVTYYYTIRLFPLTYNWENFALVAVPRESVPPEQIFGGNSAL